MKTGMAAGDVALNNQHACQVHPTAVIDPSVTLGENVTIRENVVIERNVRIGSNATIGTGCYIGEDCAIGEHTVLHHAITLRDKTQIGNHVVIESGVVIGSDGFGYAKEKDGINYKVPQVGFVLIEDYVHIGANTSIDRATLGQTLIERGARIGSLVQVGHNVQIGQDSVVGSNVGICGSCKIGNHVKIGNAVGLVGHITIGDHACLLDGAGVSKDIPEGHTMVGAPAIDVDHYEQQLAYMRELPDIFQRLKKLEDKIANNQ